jgi:peptide/nickel transport system substrate-binding protein
MTTSKPSTTTSGNWWDKLGVPQYGGEIVLRLNKDITGWDPYQGESPLTVSFGWLEQLFTVDWTLDPAIFDYKMSYRSNEYVKGNLVESWEFTDPGTYVLHVRKGIRWQNIAPANGREFTADDIAFHFHRLLGMGDGYTTPAPYWGTVAWTKSLISVATTDKYTVVFKWNTPNQEFINETFEAASVGVCIENPDAIKQWGDVNDWHHAIGTGPFILTDFVTSSSATLVKNSNYWGYDERYPQNKLPYVDRIKFLVIPDDATALAAMRTGKIDIMDQMSLNQALSMKKTNPEILQIAVPIGNGITIDPRNDKAPYNDIRVRKALQLAIDLSTIAKTYYAGTADPSPLPLTSNFMKGWGWPYSQWPQDLKDEYSYNPTAAKKLLADAGFPSGFKTNIVVDNTADLDLLQVVKSYFAAIGVDMEIRPMDTASLSAYTVTNHKNDALCQRNTGNLGLNVLPFRQLTRLMTGQPSNVGMVSDPAYDALYNKANAVTTTDDVKKIVTEANKLVVQQHYEISLLQPNIFNLYQPWLNGYNAQFGVTGSTGPQLLFVFGARFWVDQNLKKSMGH